MLTHTPLPPPPLSLTHTYTHTHTLSLSHTHTHTHPYLHLHDVNLFILLFQRESKAFLHVDLGLLIKLLDLPHLRQLTLELLLRVSKRGLQRIVFFLEITVRFHELMDGGGGREGGRERERERESLLCVYSPYAAFTSVCTCIIIIYNVKYVCLLCI